jgi:ribosomal protein S18 acetylase RimI-like enzyme
MIRIRSATHADEGLVEEIIHASMLASYAHFLQAPLFQTILDQDRPGRVARDNAPRFSVAEADGVAAGIMLLKDNYVDHLWVRPEFMGMGIGSVLLEHAEERAGHAGFDRLILDCFEKNEKALAFYRTRGFTVERISDASEYLPGENACRLSKLLVSA